MISMAAKKPSLMAFGHLCRLGIVADPAEGHV